MTEPQSVHQLEAQINGMQADRGAENRSRIDAMNDLAWSLADTDTKHAYDLAEQACATASSAGVDGDAYKTGLAFGSLQTTINAIPAASVVAKSADIESIA